MKIILRSILLLSSMLVAIIIVHSILFNAKSVSVAAFKKDMSIDTTAVFHLQQAVHFQGVSYEDSVQAGLSAIDSFTTFLKNTYPDVFMELAHETIGAHSLLLHWKGSTTSAPVLFYAHLDVVPVEGVNWRFKPFQEEFQDDTIRGRGAIDDKAGVIGILEGIHHLLIKSFKPKRDVYIAFGHDEEIGGDQGAKIISDTLEQRGVQFDWILDEGGLVAENMVPFVREPVALVMTAEKGYMTVELRVTSNGGHSSFPPTETPTDILSSALVRLHQDPFERHVIPAVDRFMDATGPQMGFPFQVLFANRWLFNPIILGEYEKIPEANAMIRTTSACTILKGGVKENVIPSLVTAVLNIRLLPGDSSQMILEQLRQKVNDPRIEIVVKGIPMEASSNASITGDGFEKISKTIREVFPDAVVAPSLSIATTDSRHFTKIVKDTYRFLPVRMDRSILSGMHGTNERLSARSFSETILFYEKLLEKN